MSCANVNGRFPDKGKLTSDASGPLTDDPPLTFSTVTGGQIVVEYDGDGKSFPVTCTNIGKLALINYTRVHDGKTTEYTGLVYPRTTPKSVLRIRGRFERTTTALAADSGDWETEKPT